LEASATTTTNSSLAPDRAVSYVEVLAKGGTVLAALAYASGYLVSAIYDAQFGFVQAEFMRPRIIIAGLAFLFFIAFPIYAGRWALDLPFHPSPDGMTSRRFKALPKVATSPTAYSAFCMVLLLATGLASEVFDPGSGYRIYGKPFICFLTLLLLGVVGQTAYLNNLELNVTSIRLSRTAAIFWWALLLLNVAVTLLILYKYSSVLLYWVIVVALFGRQESKELARHYKTRGIRWTYVVVLLAIALPVFSVKLYPNLSDPLGAHLHTIQLSMRRPSDQVATESVSARLIEESQDGFFVLIGAESRATYIPRSLVTAVRY
jgi:hypothetical protein